MPPLLKRDAVRMLEAASNCLNLGILGLGAPRSTPRIEQSRYAAELGLFGSAAELAIGACMVQAGGPKALQRESGFFKTSAQVIDDFLAVLQNPTPKFVFLTASVQKPDTHRASLRKQALKFRLLAGLRAAALHTGHASERPVCVSLANDVCDFLQLLARSSRIQPYLPNVSRPFEMVTEVSILVDDLQRQLGSATTTSSQASALANLFVVLPEVPSDEPEWIEAFDRITIAPKKNDLALLLKTLDSALPALLRKSKSTGPSLSVKVDPSDPAAIPVAPHYLRTEFTRKPDRFFADVGIANGRLNDGSFDPPPSDFVKELCALGFESTAILGPGEELTGHQAWPFVASSLALSGTPGPIWFVVRRCSDLGQLRALLDQLKALRPTYFLRNLKECESGILAIEEGRSVKPSGLFKKLLDYRPQVEARRQKLTRRIRDSEGTPKRLPSDIEAQIRAVQEDGASVGPILLDILDPKADLSDEAKAYWGRILAEVALSQDELAGVLAVLRLPANTGAHTPARKAFQLIDFLESGPGLDTDAA